MLCGRLPTCPNSPAVSLPPLRSPQVLEDNVYEQRAAAAEAAAVGEGHHPEGMEVEEPAGAAPPAELPTAAPVLRRSSLSGRTSSGGSEEASKEKKKVRFEGVAAPYVPPSRRPGFVPRWVGGWVLWHSVAVLTGGGRRWPAVPAPLLKCLVMELRTCTTPCACQPVQEHRAAAWAGGPAAAAEPQHCARPRQAPREIPVLRSEVIQD